jgi:hypothetical protein
VIIMSPNLYKRLERWHLTGDERPVDRRRRQLISSALRIRRQRRWRREGRPTFAGIDRGVAP